MKPSADKLIASGYNQVVEIQASSADGAQPTATFHFTLIGQHYPDYLILDVSRAYLWQDVLPALRNSERLIMRTISANGEVIVGYVELIHATQFPDKLLFISYPRNLQTRVLRKTPRMHIDIRAQLLREGAEKPMLNGMLKDMSGEGFGFDYNGVLPSLEMQLLGQEMLLRIQYSDDECETRAVRIKSVEERGPRQWRVGLECQLNEEERAELMQKLLLNSLAAVAIKKGERSERSISDKTLQA